MSWHWYPAGVFGLKVTDLFPSELAQEIITAYEAARNYDDNAILADAEALIYKPRYQRILAQNELSCFQD